MYETAGRGTCDYSKTREEVRKRGREIEIERGEGERGGRICIL